MGLSAQSLTALAKVRNGEQSPHGGKYATDEDTQTTKEKAYTMKITLSTSQIADALRNDSNASWSYSGACALAEYLDNLDEETGEETELDVVGVRCEFTEYDSALEAAQDHGYEVDQEENALEWLQGETEVIEFQGGVIIQCF